MSPAVSEAGSPALDSSRDCRGRRQTRGRSWLVGTPQWTTPGSLPERVRSWFLCHVAQDGLPAVPAVRQGPLPAVSEDGRVPTTRTPSDPSARGDKPRTDGVLGSRGPGACALC